MPNTPNDLTENTSNKIDPLVSQRPNSEQVLRKNLTRASFPVDELSDLIAKWSARGHHGIDSEQVQTQHLNLMESFIEKNLNTPKGPIILEGVNPPWILEAILHAPPPTNAPQFRQRILVIQHDWFELFDGLALKDFGQKIEDPRIEWFIGEQASSALLSWFEDRIDDAPPAFSISNPLLQNKTPGTNANKLMQTIEQQWKVNETALIKRISLRPKRSSSWWAQSFQEPTDDKNPLRVLIPVSRHTTYLQHIAADLCKAFKGQGITSQLLIEQDDSTVMSQPSILRAICDFDPHLIVSINYTRRSLGKCVPDDIPHLCWIQDAMDHLFTSESGKACGPRDFVVGMTKPELVQLYGYPEQRTQWMPMVASQTKFSTTTDKVRFESEIAWATHQSEHPDQMREQIFKSISAQKTESFSTLFHKIEQCTLKTNKVNLHAMLNSILDQCIISKVDPEQAKSVRSHLLNSVVYPYAERVFRHQTAQWAQKIAERKGWRLRLYGNGWEHHPTLSAYACGALEHNAALRDAYRNSRVHLHASIYQATHQRVSECTLSGGLTLCRTIRDSFSSPLMLIASSENRIINNDSLDGAHHENGAWDVSLNSSDIGQKLVKEMLRLGHCSNSEFSNNQMRWTQQSLDIAQNHMSCAITRQNAELFMSMTDLCFSSESQLESLIERAIDDQDWRHRRIERANHDLPHAMTIDGFIQNSLKMIFDTLNTQPDA